MAAIPNYEVLGLEGQTVELTDETVKQLDDRLRGRVVTPRTRGYGEARELWNGIADRRPELILRCDHPADVIEVVRFATEHDLLVAVRGGGHNVAGTATVDGGTIIDLTHARHVSVDPERRVVRAQGGATWADVDSTTQKHGLATPGGVVSDTGIGGLTLGGGIGWLRRKHGLTCDNLIGADVVTADGDVVHTDEDTNPDLLWGLRGGGGNFGVVTTFEYRLHPVGPEVMAAIVFYDGSRTVDGLRFYRDYTADLSYDVSSFAICGTVPSGEPFPEASWGDPYLLFMAVHAGDVEAGRSLLRPLREFSDPIVDLSGPMPYLEVQQFLDEDYPTGLRYYWKSLDLGELSNDVIERIAAHAQRRPSPLSTIDVWHQGGAMAEVSPEATAFGDRSAPYLLGVEANWQSAADDEANIAWTRETIADLEPLSTGREYLNFPGFMEDADTTLRAAYGDNYERLVALKRRYDPNNFFRLHQNIDPKGRTPAG